MKIGEQAKEMMEKERYSMGDAWVSQEYECSFESMEGLVYPDFEDLTKTNIHTLALPGYKKVGGIDWGFRNPFAAVWGVLDSDDKLIINHEYYVRGTPLHQIVKNIPKDVFWYADPSGRTEIEELRAAGFKILKGNNSIRLGIQAVSARARTNRLRINHGCTNLFAEAGLYRYPEKSEQAVLGEEPLDDNNHALGALRYLVSMIDKKFIAKLRKHQKLDIQNTKEEENLLEKAQMLYNYKPQESKENNLLTNEEVWTSWE